MLGGRRSELPPCHPYVALEMQVDLPQWPFSKPDLTVWTRATLNGAVLEC